MDNHDNSANNHNNRTDNHTPTATHFITFEQYKSGTNHATQFVTGHDSSLDVRVKFVRMVCYRIIVISGIFFFHIGSVRAE